MNVKPNSNTHMTQTLYSAVVDFINSHKPGDTYTTKQFQAALYNITREKNQHRMWNGQWYRVATYQTYLKAAGFITNVKRGLWKVNYRVPAWMTLGALETLRGYKDQSWQTGASAARERKERLAKQLATYFADQQALTKPTLHPFKVGDKVRLARTTSSFYSDAERYIILEGLNIGDVITIAEMTDCGAPGQYKENSFFRQSTNHGYHIPYDCFEAYTEEKPVTSTKKLVKCIDAKRRETSLVSEGTIYKVLSEEDEYYEVLADDSTPSRPHYVFMYKWRFEEVKQAAKTKTPGYPKMMKCIDASGYDYLTNGKEYTIVGERGQFYDVINDQGKEAGMYKTRFAEIQTISDTKGWKVGDILEANMLNDGKKSFHGYNNRWELRGGSCFHGDRKVEAMEIRDGQLAIRISGTADLWVAVASLPEKKENSLISEVPKDRLPEFLNELQALINRYK